jgi:hypothetical protein
MVYVLRWFMPVWANMAHPAHVLVCSRQNRCHAEAVLIAKL